MTSVKSLTSYSISFLKFFKLLSMCGRFQINQQRLSFKTKSMVEVISLLASTIIRSKYVKELIKLTEPSDTLIYIQAIF